MHSEQNFLTEAKNTHPDGIEEKKSRRRTGRLIPYSSRVTTQANKDCGSENALFTNSEWMQFLPLNQVNEVSLR